MGLTVLEPMEVESFILRVMYCYHQLLFLVLRLCLAILTSLGSQHKEAASQVSLMVSVGILAAADKTLKSP